MPRRQADARVVLTTHNDAEAARALARTLVEERLAACVQVLPPMRSLYRWNDQLHDDQEVLLVMKTTKQRFAKLKERVVALHPYDVPELVSLVVDAGLPAYLDWLAGATRLTATETRATRSSAASPSRRGRARKPARRDG